MSNYVSDLDKQDVQLKSLSDGIDTTIPTSRFFFHIMVSLAQMERDLIAERTKTGLEAVRKRGRVDGGKQSMTESKLEST